MLIHYVCIAQSFFLCEVGSLTFKQQHEYKHDALADLRHAVFCQVL
jgi:hypothetical protein